MKLSACSTALLLLLLVPQPLRAALPAWSQPESTVEGVSSYRLRNGLQVLLAPDESQPEVTVSLTYFVGSRHEGAGETGMAHLLEHMLFKGSPRFPSLDHALNEHGAAFNAETSLDATQYYETLVGTDENLRFAIAVEADRMNNAWVRQRDLDKEFQVVRNELEIGENDPAQILAQRMTRCAYSWHGYGRDTIGTRSDIEGVKATQLELFRRKYYRPDNAVLIVAGKFSVATAQAVIDKELAKLPRPTTPIRSTYTVEPIQDGERQVVLRRSGEQQLVAVAYHTPAAAHADYIAVDALADILTRDGTGRIYTALVQKGLATAVSSRLGAEREPSLLELGVTLRRDQSIEATQRELLRIVEGLAETPLTERELNRFKARYRKEFSRTMAKSTQLVPQLSQWSVAGDYRLWFLLRDRAEALTLADVQRVARQVLIPSNRTLGLFIPTDKPVRTPLFTTPEAKPMVTGYRGQAAPASGEVFAPTVANIEQRVERLTLPSGLQVALLPKKTRGQEVRIFLGLQYGSAAQLAGKTAVSELLGTMLLRGTTKKSYPELLDEQDRLRAELFSTGGTAQVQSQELYLGGATTREHAAEVLTLLAEIVRSPSFPKEELELVRKEALLELEESQRNPSATGRLALLRHIRPFPPSDARYVPTIEEQLQRLRAVTPEQLLQLHRELIGGSHGALAIVGDFDAAELKQVIAKQLGMFRSPQPYLPIQYPVSDAPGTLLQVHTPDKAMAMAALLQPMSASENAPDHAGLKLLEYVLAGDSSARLFQRLREKDGLSYSVEGRFYIPAEHHSAYVTAVASCAPQNAQRAIAALTEEVSALGQRPLSATELKTMQLHYQQAFESKLASDAAVTAMLGLASLRHRTLQFDADQLQRAVKLTPTELMDVAKRYIRPERFIKLLAGDLPAETKPTPTAPRQPAENARPAVPTK